MKTTKTCPQCKGSGKINRKVRSNGSLPNSVRKEYETGKTISEIANEHGSQPYFVRYKIVQLGGKIRKAGGGKGGSKLTDEERQELIKGLSEGASLGDLAAKFSLTFERVRQIAWQSGVMQGIKEKRRALTEESIRLIVQARLERAEAQKKAHLDRLNRVSELLTSGATYVDCAAALGISPFCFASSLVKWRKAHPGMFPFKKP